MMPLRGRYSVAVSLTAALVLCHEASAQSDGAPVFLLEPSRPNAAFGQVSDVIADSLSGRVYIADAMARSISVFRTDGSFEFSFGRPGSGPGEFAHSPVGLAIWERDLIVADDLFLHRFTLDGEYVGRIRFEPENRIAVILTVDSSPGFLLVGTREASPNGQHFGLYTVRSGKSTVLSRIPFPIGAEVTRGERSYWGVADRRVLISRPDSLAVMLRDPAGGPDLNAQIRESDRPFQDSDVTVLRERLTAQCKSSAIPTRCRQAASTAIQNLEAKSGDLPPIGPVVGNQHGQWVLARADGPESPFSPTYSAFDLFDFSHQIGGTVRLPGEIKPMSFSNGIVWGVAFGPFDEPVVTGYRITPR